MFRQFVFIILFFPAFVFSQSFPEKPSGYVTDVVGRLSDAELSSLNKKCRDFENITSNQVFVYLAGSLDGQDMQQLCQAVFTKWEIGQKGKDNGVLIAVFVDDNKFRIHTGYGLEGNLPDLLTKKIQDENMRIEFKHGKFYQGLEAGIDKIIYYSAHTYVEETDYVGWILTGVLIFVFMGFNGLVYLVLRSSLKNDKKIPEQTRKIMKSWGKLFIFIPFFGAFAIVIIIMIYSKKYGGGIKWGSGGLSGGLGGSSSSFGGGGGGRSGGGGSSSSW